jgi:hypothetical protein
LGLRGLGLVRRNWKREEWEFSTLMCEVEGEKAGFLFIYNNLFVYEGDLLTEQNAMFPLRVNELSLLLWNYGRDIVKNIYIYIFFYLKLFFYIFKFF